MYSDAITSALSGSLGITVCGEASSSGDAIERVSELNANVVLIDSSVDRAVSTVRSLRRACPNAGVVVLAASDAVSDLIEFAEVGAGGFVMRDDSLDQLIAVIRGVTCGEPPYPSRLVWGLLKRVSVLGGQRLDSGDDGPLTTRELEIADLITQGLSNKEIGRRLHIEVATVKNHVHHILEKLRIQRRTDVARYLTSGS